MWVNNVKIVGWTKVNNGVIFAVEDYLFTEHIGQHLKPFPRSEDDGKEGESSNEISDSIGDAVSTTAGTTTTTTATAVSTTFITGADGLVRRERCEPVNDKSSIFKRIVVCVEEWVEATKAVKDDDHKEMTKSVRRAEEEEDLPSFLQDIVDVLSVLRFGSSDFLQYMQTAADIKDKFEDSERDTRFLNKNDAKLNLSPFREELHGADPV